MRLQALSLLLFTPLIFGQDKPPEEAHTAAGCGPTQITFGVKTLDQKGTLEKPEEGKAIVYVFQDEKSDPHKRNYGHATIRAGVDGKWMGATYGDSYFSFPVNPGDHHVCIDWQSRFKTLSKLGSAVTFMAEAGKAYYFRAEVLPAREQLPPALKLEAVDIAEGQLQISSRWLVSSYPGKGVGEKWSDIVRFIVAP